MIAEIRFLQPVRVAGDPAVSNMVRGRTFDEALIRSEGPLAYCVEIQGARSGSKWHETKTAAERRETLLVPLSNCVLVVVADEGVVDGTPTLDETPKAKRGKRRDTSAT